MRNRTLKRERVKDTISFRILSGEYKIAGRIPPERELCETLNISRVTLRSAVNSLIEEGVLTRQGRRGTLIRKTPTGISKKRENSKQKTMLFAYFSSIKGESIVHSGVSARLFRGLETFANEHEYALLVQSGENVSALRGGILESIDGIIVGGSNLNIHLPDILKKGIPMIAVDVIPHRLPIDAISIDNYHAGIQAADIITRHQYKNPLIIQVKFDDEDFLQPNFTTRSRGIKDTLAGTGVSVQDITITHKDLRDGVTAQDRLRNTIKHGQFDSIIHLADITYSYLKDITELPTIVFGAEEHFVDPTPNCHVIPFNMERMGYMAAKRLDERMLNPHLEIERILLPIKTN